MSLRANVALRKCCFMQMLLRANVASCKCRFTQMSLNHFSLLGWLVKWTSGAKSLLTFLTLLSNKTMVRESVSAKASARVEGKTTSAASATTLWLQSYWDVLYLLTRFHNFDYFLALGKYCIAIIQSRFEGKVTPDPINKYWSRFNIYTRLSKQERSRL